MITKARFCERANLVLIVSRIKSEVNYDEYGCKDGESIDYDKNGVAIKKKIYSKDVLVKEISLKNSLDKN